MKLKRLTISRLPGISQPYAIEASGAGFNVIYGPNGIGKSSICRAVEGLYWEECGPSQRISLIGEFDLDGEAWWAEREGARVRWQRGGEDSARPSLPSPHHQRCFFLRLRDLINPAKDGTQDVASEIRRQMSGGYDLDRITSELFPGVGARHGRRERSDFNAASLQVQQAELKQAGLQRRADQLDSLRAQLEVAETEARRLPSLERALGLVKRLEELSIIEAELVALPRSLSNLTGDALEQIRLLQGQLDELSKRARSQEDQLRHTDDARRDARLAAPLPSAELSAWRAKADELDRVEIALQAARNEHSTCEGELASAISALGVGHADVVQFDLGNHGQVFEFLRAAEAHRTRVNVIDERLRLLERVERPEDGPGTLERSRSAVDALRSWLRAPEPEIPSEGILARRPWIILAITMILTGIGLAVLVHLFFALLAAVGAGIALPLLMLRVSKGSSEERKAARDSFDRLGVDGPRTWDIPSVADWLRKLESETASLDARLQRARDRDVESETLRNELAGLSEAEAALEAKRQKLKTDLRLDVTLPDAELVDFARSLDQLRLARGKEMSAAGKARDLEKRQTELLSDLSDVLEKHGELRPEDGATAGAYLGSLADRHTKLVQAISEERQAKEQLGHISEDSKKALGSITGIYADAMLEDGDLHGLTELLGLLPRHLELQRLQARLESQNDLDRNELAKSGEVALADCDTPMLERLHEELSHAAETATKLRDEMAEIGAQVNEARKACTVQTLISAREEIRSKLQERLNEALFAKAGKFLLNGVEEEYERTQMPRVFERAREHFSSFTHHSYELRLGGEAGMPRLVAIDLRSGEGMGLEELSDGTRVQLLLAARIAFAEEVEQGKVLPLFLDEALDQSDPGRFDAIVRSLGRVANDQGRQIFYLTSDPFDAERIQNALAEENCEIAAAIDLGMLRTKTASVRDAQALRIGQRPAIPAPDGASPEEYGLALGIPEFRPMAGPMGQHFFYVVADDLELLHDFLSCGIERVGQWKIVSGTALADKLGSRSISAAEIGFRLDLLEFFCELWTQGRGRPVDREALENSGTLSVRFLGDVADIAKELAGDAEKLVAILAENNDPRLRGFRRATCESLERYLRDNGYIDNQPVLADGDLRLRALASPAANNLPAGVADQCLSRWWNWAAIGHCK